MGALVLLSDFTEKDNVFLKKKMKELFLDKKYTLSYIPSMTDRNLKCFEKTKNKLSEYGNFEFNYFDIDYFCNIEKIDKIFKSEVIYLSSGNTYYFLNSLKKRYFITRLRRYVENGGYVIGLSAGAIMMAKDISAAQFGDEDIVGLSDLSSLDLVDFDFMPHWNHHSHYLEDLKEYSNNTGNTVYTCNDGDGIIVIDNKLHFYGDIKMIKEGEIRKA
ncbi:peptidase E [Clostridium sp. CM028]|uniref:Type 1 glutamine amidotransferase-like domain-containing protein n=1 Tax=unclassified Clostridium TaxID=2614128 RepID=UPI001C0B9276|nr:MULTISPECIES: Type 1 glutamine amidotransferase-like domain-containing protein [unclassified Clostridium]MBU3091823.1 peptidase E [Clostridium sp. CF011]MBW9145391.1 peptidase E [Clostridium sp. CM027]MBW9148789.1 peptidase E [Clostridium sp. CM028]UVE42529.1 peptidase E [Clostridium sp. CM027]WAG68277.1 peptidase E [Clostridium sp. CF011]